MITPCAVKAARTVWSRGKVGDYIKDLPMAIRLQVPLRSGVFGERRRASKEKQLEDMRIYREGGNVL